MKRRMKEQLKALYAAPAPVGKRAFFRERPLPPLRIGRLLWMQCGYITKWEWVLSVIMFAVAVGISLFEAQYMLSLIFALMPVLAVVAVSESARSVIYGMDELEMAARFSLKSVILAKMVVVGIANALLTLAAALLIDGGFTELIIYLLAPYLLTAYGSLILIRMISGREGIYACVALGVFIGIAAGVSVLQYNWLYQPQYVGMWMLAVCFLLYAVLREGKRNYWKMEELVWN